MRKYDNKEAIMRLFFDYPMKRWHFKEIRDNLSLADNKISRWMRKLESDGIVKRRKERGKHPYYVAEHESAGYRTAKKNYANSMFAKSGLISHLYSLDKARTVIIFGSFSRSDWHRGSDLDIFIYGDDSLFDKAGYENILGKDIQLFSCRTKKELKKMGPELLKNVVKGDLIKGDLDFLEMRACA